MDCFRLFLCWGVGVWGNYGRFGRYRVLRFNKEIYGSEEMGERGGGGEKEEVVIGRFGSDVGRDVCRVGMERR